MPEQPANRPDGRIVDFREAAASRARAAQQAAARQSPVADLAQYERPPDEDDYRHRMGTNGIALVFIAILVIAGVWIADTMATMRKNQDCVLSGRRGCTPVEAPILHR
jgi:hypothetical protein